MVYQAAVAVRTSPTAITENPPDVISDKLVHRRRGGYCFEHALLLAAVLERLGFAVQRRMARVQPHGSGVRTHMMLTVHADGVEYLADVGFGAGMRYPMPLRDGAVVDQAGWAHRLTQDGALWTLWKRSDQGWEALHAFDDSPQRPIDYEVAHHYTATHPRSPFTGGYLAGWGFVVGKTASCAAMALTVAAYAAPNAGRLVGTGIAVTVVAGLTALNYRHRSSSACSSTQRWHWPPW